MYSLHLSPSLGKKLLGKIVVLIRTGSKGHYPCRIPGPVFLYLLINFSPAVSLDPDLTREEGGGARTGEEEGWGALPINLLSQKLSLDMSRPEYYPN